MCVIKHFLYSIGQREIRILNRYEVQIAGAHIVSRVNGIHAAIGRNDVKDKEVRLLHLVFVALDLRANTFALNGDPFLAANHAAKLLLDLVFIRYLPVDGTVGERQTQVAGTNDILEVVLTEPPLVPDKCERTGAAVDLFRDDIRRLVFLHARHILNAGFICLGQEFREAAFLFGFAEEDSAEQFEAHEPARILLLRFGQRIAFSVHGWFVLLDTEKLGYIIALAPCTRKVRMPRQNGQREADTLRDSAGHLHGFDAEILGTQEFKLRFFGHYGIDLNINTEISWIELCFLYDDLPAFDLRKANTILTFDGLHVLDALD